MPRWRKNACGHALPSTPLRFDVFSDVVDEQFANCDACGVAVLDGVALDSDQLLSQSFRLNPISYSQDSLVFFWPMLNVASAAVDYSGNDRPPTVENTLAEAADTPPVPWVGPPAG